MSAERRPSFSDIVLTLEGMEGEEQKEASIALGKNVLRLYQMRRMSFTAPPPV